MPDTTVLNNPYGDEPRLQRDDILARLLGISQLAYEDDQYTHHDGSVWDYFGELSYENSPLEAKRFWHEVTGIRAEINNDYIVFEHGLEPYTGLPIEMDDEIGAPDDQRPRYDRAFNELPLYVWAINDRRRWRDQLINAASDASMGYGSALADYNEAKQHLPGKRPKPF